MVKKKAPFIPITIIVIGVGVIFGMNARNHPVDPEAEMKAKQEAMAQNRPKDSDTDVQNAIKKGLDGQPPHSLKPDPHVPVRQEDEDGKANPMLVPKQHKYHPTPNGINADQQWYKPN